MAAIDDELLAILACPETQKDLELADDDQLAKINAAIEQGQLSNKSKNKVTKKLDGGLFRAGDRSVVYPIYSGVPVLLIDEQIALGDTLQ